MPDELHASDPRALGPYRIIGRLGRGGMGTVYLGEDGSGGRVAVKVINAEYVTDSGLQQRFRAEVAAARRVRRFCTAPVLDAALDAPPWYIVTEYIPGPTLEEAVSRSGPLTGSSLDGLAVGVATALAAIHDAGLIHRDLKPANVLLSSVGPRVIDFGIARLMDAQSGLTATGTIVGTPAYLAPELVLGGELTPAADVFSWACVITYAGTGRSPFEGGTLPAILHRVAYDPPRLDGLDPGLRPLVERALAKNPGDRPQLSRLLGELSGGSVAPMPTRVAQAAPPPVTSPMPPSHVTPPPRTSHVTPSHSQVTPPPMTPPPMTPPPRTPPPRTPPPRTPPPRTPPPRTRVTPPPTRVAPPTPTRVAPLTPPPMRAPRPTPPPQRASGAVPPARGHRPPQTAPQGPWPQPARPKRTGLRIAVTTLICILLVGGAAITLLWPQLKDFAKEQQPGLPAALVGTWSGQFSETGSSKAEYKAVFTLKAGKIGEVVGRSRYSSLDCVGSLRLVEVSSTRVRVQETITTGRDNCYDVPLTLTLRADGRVSCDYNYLGAEGRAILSKQ